MVLGPTRWHSSAGSNGFRTSSDTHRAVSCSWTNKVQEAEGLEAGVWHGLGVMWGGGDQETSINRARGAGVREDEKFWARGVGPEGKE